MSWFQDAYKLDYLSDLTDSGVHVDVKYQRCCEIYIFCRDAMKFLSISLYLAASGLSTILMYNYG